MLRLPALVTLLCAGLLGLSAMNPVAAQEPMVSGLPATPDPAECTVAAPTFEEIMARGERLLATPAASTPVPPPNAETFVPPDGEPADAAVVEGIGTTMRELVACINTGNYLTIFEFTTANYLLATLAEELPPPTDAPGGTPTEAMPMGTPPALAPDEYVTLVAVRDITRLTDNRAGAFVETIFPAESPEVQVDYFYFIEEDGRWLVDGIVEDLEGGYPPISATPAP